MSLSIPEAPKSGDWAQTGDDEYVCYTSETLFAAIEKCLDNGLGTCLVVEDEDRYVGRISLDDIGKAVLNGALLNPSLDQHVEVFAHRLANDPSSDSQVLQPVLDATGKLVGITIDRSSQHVQVARPDMTHDEFRSVMDAFLSSWISSKGPYVGKFEQDFDAFIGFLDQDGGRRCSRASRCQSQGAGCFPRHYCRERAPFHGAVRLRVAKDFHHVAALPGHRGPHRRLAAGKGILGVGQAGALGHGSSQPDAHARRSHHCVRAAPG